MGGLENRPVIAKSEGRTVWDTDGKAYLDFQSGQMGAALGHQHPRMVKRITATMESLLHSSNTMLNVPRLRLHEKLGKILPRPLEKSALVSGSDSIEASIDLARKATGGLDIIESPRGPARLYQLRHPFGFLHLGTSETCGGGPAHRFRFDALLLSLSARPEVPQMRNPVPNGQLGIGRCQFHGTASRFHLRSVLSAGGIIVPPEGCLSRVKAECDKRGMELIMDEAQTGLGKTGKLFGFQHEPGLKPGIIALSKHFGGGLPISAVCTTADVAKRAVGRVFRDAQPCDRSAALCGG